MYFAIVFYLAAIVADIYAFGAMAMMTVTLIFALLGMGTARRTFRHGAGMLLTSIIATTLTTPPFIAWLVKVGSSEILEEVVAGTFIIAMHSDFTSLVTLTNPYPALNPHQLLLLFMVGYFILVTGASLVLIILRFGIGALAKSGEPKNGKKEAKWAKSSAPKKTVKSAPSTSTYRIRSSDGSNENLRTPL